MYPPRLATRLRLVATRLVIRPRIVATCLAAVGLRLAARLLARLRVATCLRLATRLRFASPAGEGHAVESEPVERAQNLLETQVYRLRRDA